VVTVVACGRLVSATTNARNFRVSYTLRAHDRTLNHETFTDSSFLIQRKAYCPSTVLSYVREDDANRFRYSCWSCPINELRAQAPLFLGDQVVRWYRSNECPTEFDQRLTDSGDLRRPILKKNQTELPLAVALSATDTVQLSMLREAPYGRLAELRCQDGARVFFIGDGAAGAVLAPANAGHGSLTEHNGTWVWTTAEQTRYRFGPVGDGISKAISKQTRDGKIWRYRWRVNPGSAITGTEPMTAHYRIETMTDPTNQLHTYQYNRAGKLTSVIMQHSDYAERVAKQ